jgi:small redox-active disulfide protein 2
MDIKVLGPGCPRCGEVEKRVKNALAELNVTAAVEKITDIKKIMEHQIMTTPGLIINGKIRSMGRIPSLGEIKSWIREAE